MKQVYIHGLGQTPESWDAVLRGVGAPADCICPNLTKMTGGGETTYWSLYHAFSRFCDGLETPLALCGLSLGGVLALHYAAQHPEHVGALVLIAPQYKMPKRLLQIQNLLFRFLPQSMFRGTGFAKSQFIQLCGSMMDLDLSRELSAITCPTLILCGSRDRANKLACTALVSLLTQAELHIVEGAGHAVNQDAPEQLAALLRDFHSRTQAV